MFEVNGVYVNRKGKYTVLAINPPKMSVRYEDGTYAELNIGIQERIWENIVAEQEARAASRLARANRQGLAQNTQFFIKVVSMPAPGELLFPGWHERVVLARDEEVEQIKSGDRLIYYALENQVFFAVATITGPAIEASPKDYFFNLDSELAHFFPVDVDAAAFNLATAVPLDSVELESQPNFGKLKLAPESYVKINEDDFELLAELLTEITEFDEDEGEDLEEYEEEEED